MMARRRGISSNALLSRGHLDVDDHPDNGYRTQRLMSTTFLSDRPFSSFRMPCILLLARNKSTAATTNRIACDVLAEPSLLLSLDEACVVSQHQFNQILPSEPPRHRQGTITCSAIRMAAKAFVGQHRVRKHAIQVPCPWAVLGRFIDDRTVTNSP